MPSPQLVKSLILINCGRNHVIHQPSRLSGWETSVRIRTLQGTSPVIAPSIRPCGSACVPALRAVTFPRNGSSQRTVVF